MSEENMSINSETIGKDYEEDLQERIEEGVHAPQTNTKLFKGIVIGLSAIIFGIGGMNYTLHNGPQEQKYTSEARNIAKPTGLVSYVEYRELKDVPSFDGSTYEQIDVIIKGSLLGKEDAYLDYNQDKKVDKIFFDVNSSRDYTVLTRRTDHNNWERKELDKADKYFAKHIEKLSKKAVLPK